MGAEVNAGTGKETTSVHSRFLDGHLERAFDVLQDMVLRPAYPDIDSERQVVIEEIAMYEDEPPDKVHDVLAGAVFGDHPLGRPIIGRADVIGVGAGADRSRRGTTAATCRATSWSPPPATSSTSGSSRSSTGAFGGAAPLPVAPGLAGRPRAGPALPREGDRAVPPLHRRSRHPARRRAPLRASHPRHDPGRLDLVAPVPGGAREARPRLRRLLLREPLPRHRPGGRLRGHAARQRGRGDRRDRRRARARAGRGSRARRSSSARARTSRAARCCRWSRRSPA